MSIEYLSVWPPPTDGVEAENASESLEDQTDERGFSFKADIEKLEAAEDGKIGVKRTKIDGPLLRAETFLAKALKRGECSGSDILTSSHIPTALDKFAQSPQGQKCLRRELLRILTLVRKQTKVDSLRKVGLDTGFVMSTYYEALGFASTAFDILKTILRQKSVRDDLLDLDVRRYLVELSKFEDDEDLLRECLHSKERIGLSLSCQKENSYHDSPKFEVERIPMSEMSVERMRSEFVEKSKPVILTNILEENEEPISWEILSERLGNTTVPLKRRDPDSKEWARLVPTSSEVKFKDFLSDLDKEGESRYLFDWSIPLNCPEILRPYAFLKYFEHNFLKKTSEGSLYKDSWPSLFVAPKNVISDLHVDAFASNFWMALFEGRKKWTFYPREAVPALNPDYSKGLDPVFNPKEDLGNIPKFEVVLEEKELLFVPHGYPHKVENLDKSIAISSNFVDSSNIQETVIHLKRNSLVDPRAADLLKEFLRMEIIKP